MSCFIVHQVLWGRVQLSPHQPYVSLKLGKASVLHASYAMLVPGMVQAWGQLWLAALGWP